MVKRDEGDVARFFGKEEPVSGETGFGSVVWGSADSGAKRRRGGE